MLQIIIITSIYFCLISWISYKHSKDDNNYYQIRKNIPVTILAFSVFATLLSPISFLTLVGNAYTGNYYLWFAQCGIFIAIPIATKYFLPLYLNNNYETAYHILEQKFQSKNIRSFASGIYIIYQLGRIAVITYLLTQSLTTFININQIILSGLILLLTVYYTAKGGLLVVLYTDFFQGLVLITIISLFIPNILQSEIIANNNSQHLFKFIENLELNTIIILIIGSGINSLFSYISSQDIVQRFNSEKNDIKTKKVLWIQGILSFSIATLLYFIGILIRENYFTTSSTNPILIEYAQKQLSPLFAGLIMLALLAAGQSTISSSINAIVTCLKFDFSWLNIKILPKTISFIITIISWIICSILMNSNIYSIYTWINGFMGLTLGTIGGLYILILILKQPTLKIAKIYLIISLSTLILYNYSNIFIEKNPWINSIITTISAILVSSLIKLFSKKYKKKDKIQNA